MTIKNIKLAAIAGMMILTVASCMKDDSSAQKAEEKRILDQYILANNITVTPTKSGLYYIETLAGTGDSAELKTWIEIEFTGRVVSNNAVFITSDMQVAKDNNIFIEGIYYGPTRRILGYIPYAGLNQGIAMMREGGKARLIFPSDLGMGGLSAQNVPSYSSMIFDIELLHVIPDPGSYESGLMMEYLQANGISTDSTDSGIYIKVTTPGVGDFPTEGNEVTLTYTGKFMNGIVFDGINKSLKLQIGANSVIPGFEDGVKLINEGGSARIVIPYYYAYGDYGKVDSYLRSVIPPFTTLVFDITVNSITKK